MSIEFKANKDYYLGAPDFDRLVFKKVQSSNILSGLMSGEIDALSGNTQILWLTGMQPTTHQA